MTELRVAVIGVGRMGMTHAENLAKRVHGAELVAVTTSSAARAAEARRRCGAVSVYDDLDALLEAEALDAVVIATPNHWHAPMTIMACKAGKHVYVEKPCSHNPQEGEWMIAAAKKFGRCVQMGTQRRSAAQTGGMRDMADDDRFVWLRLYGPLESWFDQTWRLREVESVE